MQAAMCNNPRVVRRLREQIFPKWKENTEAAALVVIDLSTAIGARVGSTVEECVREGSSSIVPPPFWNHIIRISIRSFTQIHLKLDITHIVGEDNQGN